MTIRPTRGIAIIKLSLIIGLNKQNLAQNESLVIINLEQLG